MTDHVRWAVLGNATIARKCMLPAIAKSRNGRLSVLATRRPEDAAALLEKHKDVRVTDDYDTAICDPEVDAVYIPLPNHLHHPWTIKALQAGKHVLCEKPLACTARQADEMAAAAADAGCVLMEALMYRFHPRSLKVKQLVAAGEIGTPRLVRVAFTFAMDPLILAAGNNPRLKPEMGGGALLDVGCYGVSTVTWLLGGLPGTVHGMADRHPVGVDTVFVGTLEFAAGTLASIEAGFVTALQQTYTVTGTRGSIELPHNAFVPWEAAAFFTVRGLEDETGTQYRIDGADEYQLMVEHFSDVVAGVSEPAIPISESVGNMRVLDALAESARTGKRVAL